MKSLKFQLELTCSLVEWTCNTVIVTIKCTTVIDHNEKFKQYILWFLMDL